MNTNFRCDLIFLKWALCITLCWWLRYSLYTCSLLCVCVCVCVCVCARAHVCVCVFCRWLRYEQVEEEPIPLTSSVRYRRPSRADMELNQSVWGVCLSWRVARRSFMSWWVMCCQDNGCVSEPVSIVSNYYCNLCSSLLVLPRANKQANNHALPFTTACSLCSSHACIQLLGFSP